VSAMPASTLAERMIRALYCHGPCSAGTLAGLVGEDDAGSVARALQPMIGSKVSTKTVALPGIGVSPVELLFLRGNGVG